MQEKELKEFVEWCDIHPRKCDPDELEDLFVAYKVEKGFWEKDNWTFLLNNVVEDILIK